MTRLDATRLDPKDDPLFRPLSAKVLPATAFQTLTGRQRSLKVALMSSRMTLRQGYKGPPAPKVGVRE